MAKNLMDEEDQETPPEEEAEPVAEEQDETPAEEQAEAPAEAPQPARNSKSVAAIKKLFSAVGSIIYGEKSSRALLKIIQQSPKPEVGIAQAALMVMKQIKDSAKGVPPKVFDKLAKPVAFMLADIADAAGVIEDDPQIPQKAAAMIQAVILKVQGQAGTPNAGPGVPPAVQPQGVPSQGMNVPSRGMIAQQMGG